MLRNPALTVAISPQPDVLESLSDKPGFRGRGLIARWLYGLPKSPLGFRELKPMATPPAVEKAYCEGIGRLLRLAPPRDEASIWQPWQLRFSPQAYEAWKEFQRSVEILMREGGKLYYLKDWASKLPGAAARIAGVLHCVVADPTESIVISEDTTERTLNLVTALIDHALAVFNLMERDKNSENAQKVLAWIRKHGGSSFTVRDCFCAHQSRFKTMDGIRPPLNLLEQRYYIRPRPRETVSHRPSEVYDVNPRVLEVSA
jgi:putative DNA primase/helicase